MPKKIFLSFWCLVVGLLFFTSQAKTQEVKVHNSPRPFTVVPPASWMQQPTMTGNSRVKFASPSGTPYAECAVIVQEYPALRGKPQSVFDQLMAEPPDSAEMASHLSAVYNNVKVFTAIIASISGYPAHLANYQSSVGTPSGEQWMRGIMVTTITTPGLIWTITCGALGRSPNEAEKGYSYWQSEIVRFPTNIKIR